MSDIKNIYASMAGVRLWYEYSVRASNLDVYNCPTFFFLLAQHFPLARPLSVSLSEMHIYVGHIHVPSLQQEKTLVQQFFQRKNKQVGYICNSHITFMVRSLKKLREYKVN